VGSLVQGIFGKKKAPKYTPYEAVDAGAEAGRAIQGNLDNFGDIADLVEKTNKLNQSQRNGMVESAMPGWRSLTRSMTDAFGSYMDDLASGGAYGLPEDFEANIDRLAAERGISAGTRGQFNDFSLLRDFGVNSLNYAQQQAQMLNSMTNSLMSIANFSTVAPVLAQSFFVTPEQQIALTERGNYLNWIGRNQNNAAQADAWNWNRQNLVGGLAQGAVYAGNAIGSYYDMKYGGGMLGGGSGSASQVGNIANSFQTGGNMPQQSYLPGYQTSSYLGGGLSM
jgi:hypothetical protein